MKLSTTLISLLLISTLVGCQKEAKELATVPDIIIEKITGDKKKDGSQTVKFFKETFNGYSLESYTLDYYTDNQIDTDASERYSIKSKIPINQECYHSSIIYKKSEYPQDTHNCYDSDGFLEISHVSKENDSGSITKVIHYYYNSNGQMIEKHSAVTRMTKNDTVSEDNTIETYSYYEDGFKESYTLTLNDKLKTKLIYDYNEDKTKRSSRKYTDIGGRELVLIGSSASTIKNIENNQVQEITNVFDNSSVPKLTRYIVKKYDANKNLIEVSGYDPEDSQLYQYNYTYKKEETPKINRVLLLGYLGTWSY